MKTQTKKSFICSKFGFKFRIVIDGTNTVAIMLKYSKRYVPEGEIVGLAILHTPDVYNAKLGTLIAIKAALTKYHSLEVAKDTAELAGFQSQMRSFNKNLADKIEDER